MFSNAKIGNIHNLDEEVIDPIGYCLYFYGITLIGQEMERANQIDPSHFLIGF